MKMKRTGNPFVDMGWCTITALAKKESVSDLELEDIKQVFKQYNIADINKRLKSFTMVFGTNGPLYQNSFKPNNKAIYHDFLEVLIQHFDNEFGQAICEICGEQHNFDIHTVWTNIVAKYKIEVKQEKMIGRDFFPLIGSLGNDAQALPGASRTVAICPKCLFAVNYIPIGTMLIKGRLICVESTSEIIMIELVNDIVAENLRRISLGNTEIYGKKEGNTEIYYRLLNMFYTLQSIKKWEKLPKSTALFLWLFSNSGTGADCDIIEIPNRALKFIWEISTKGQGFKKEFINLIRQDKKKILFDCITQNTDYYLLYPKGKYLGVSPELYAYYQINVAGRTGKSLNFAKKIAVALTKGKTEKEIKQLQKSDVFKEQKNINAVKKVIVDFVFHGEAQLQDYLYLINRKNHYLNSDFEAYRVIMYYLNHIDAPEMQEEEDRMELKVCSRNTHKKIKDFAKLYFRYYVIDREEGLGRGINRFRTDILEQFNKKINQFWLRENFAKMAEIYELESLKLDYDGWLDFITDEDGNKQVYELLFQLRLAFANLYYQYNKEA